MADKRAAEGTPAYGNAVKACSEAIMDGYNKYTAGAKEKLCDAQSGSKQCWNLSRELLSQLAKTQSIPAMKSENGEWVLEQTDEANLLARTFGSKNVLPEQATNEYSDLERKAGSQKQLRTLQVEEVTKILEGLDENSGTGPNLLPTRILKNCAAHLAYPILQFALLI